MKLALREMRRRPRDFLTAAVLLTLIAMLLMLLGGLLDGAKQLAQFLLSTLELGDVAIDAEDGRTATILD